MPPVPEKGCCLASCQCCFPPPQPPGSPQAVAGKRGPSAPALQGGLIRLRPRSLRERQPSPQGRTGGEGRGTRRSGWYSGETLCPPGPQMPAEPAKAEGQTQACCPAPPGTYPRAPSLHQLPQLLCTIKPPDWVLSGQVPPSHRLEYHQVRYSGATEPLGWVP